METRKIQLFCGIAFHKVFRFIRGCEFPFTAVCYGLSLVGGRGSPGGSRFWVAPQRAYCLLGVAHIGLDRPGGGEEALNSDLRLDLACKFAPHGLFHFFINALCHV